MSRKLTNHHPKQSLFADNYIQPTSPTFGNCYQSAIRAGYSHATAKNLTSNAPKWLLEIYGNIQVTPERLVTTLSEIMDNPEESTSNRIRAIELLMRATHMLDKPSVQHQSVNIQLHAKQYGF